MNHEPEAKMRTVHLRVSYRMQIPTDIPLIRCGVDRKLSLPPMKYFTGWPDGDGGPGTWKSHTLVGDFLTFQEQWGEGDGFLWEAEARVEALTAERDEARLRLAEATVELARMRSLLGSDRSATAVAAPPLQPDPDLIVRVPRWP